MIHLQEINKTYQGAQPLHVLKGINLDIAKGEFVSIMGASGSGKSTLLNILGILDNYDSGTYELAGVPIWNLSERKAADYRNRMIGFIFQSFNLISFKTAVENVELPLFYQGVPRRKRHQMALEYLERLGLLDWAEHYPNELSGGQKQRVAIARALITRPQIILADDTVLDMDYLIRLVRYTALVRHHHDGHILLLVQLLEQLHHLHRGLRVQCARRLIGQDNLWTGDECSGYCHALFLSSRQLVGIMVGPV